MPMVPVFAELLSPDQVREIHGTSMRVLDEVGVVFPHPRAVAVFARHGFRVEGSCVHLSERQVMDALATAPARFTVYGRDPAKNLDLGGPIPVLAPAVGAPFLLDPETGVRKPRLQDCHNLAKLCHMLPEMHLTGHVTVMPDDVPADKAHLHGLLACLTHSDKPFTGSVAGEIGAQHSMDMASILFEEPVGGRTVMLGGVNSLTPLGYSAEMLGALLVYAERGQALMIGSAAMAGSTAPITLAGLLAVQNAELLAGIVLTQLVRPGAPVIYGSASGNMDMRSAALCIGSPEFSILTAAHAQLARFYGIPCKSGGALTDAHSPDYQAGLESMFGLLTAIQCGVDYIIHAAGILSSFRSFSYEKFILDAEMCGMLLRYRRGLEVTPDTLAYDLIAAVGPGGNYLVEKETVRRCRTEFWSPAAMQREGLEAWSARGQSAVLDRARARWQALLADHEDPPLDKTVARQLQRYVEAST